jgi:hypothetical protein
MAVHHGMRDGLGTGQENHATRRKGAPASERWRRNGAEGSVGKIGLLGLSSAFPRISAIGIQPFQSRLDAAELAGKSIGSAEPCGPVELLTRSSGLLFMDQ